MTYEMVPLCWMLTGKCATFSSIGTCQKGGLGPPFRHRLDEDRIWLMARTFKAGPGIVSWRNQRLFYVWSETVSWANICCYILTVELTLGQLGAPDALVSGPYQELFCWNCFSNRKYSFQEKVVGKAVVGLKSFLSMLLKYNFLVNWLKSFKQFQFYQQLEKSLWISKNMVFLEILLCEECCGFKFSSKSWINNFSKNRKYVMGRDFHFLASHGV